ncbi:hypothetical protein GNI_056810 [Gregarina niphandrodes]|uniref:Uncharacterized protein n=1 Tax=Gregarina niphandrodes TaxID=110365 RepID=A0A023B8P4_GRENI|nr:hypothetical protein GNI_056810 [Gregarina niphandrodes]EZG69890.1 hypothetical protein GNI_056810 [Gregarina niphandrodes]|eukprot:XP_011129984.1 hypothetical protein GNI_056810 [Gregarina niphandrodes]
MLIGKVLTLAAVTGAKYTSQLSLTYVGPGCRDVRPCDHGGDLGKAILCGIALDQATADYAVEDDTKDAILDQSLLPTSNESPKLYSNSNFIGEADNYWATEEDDHGTTDGETTDGETTDGEEEGRAGACNMLLRWTATFDADEIICGKYVCVPDDIAPWLGRLHLHYIEQDGPDQLEAKLVRPYNILYVTALPGGTICDKPWLIKIPGEVSQIFETTNNGYITAWRTVPPPGVPLRPCFNLGGRFLALHTYQVYGNGNQLVYLKPYYESTLIQPRDVCDDGTC